MVSGVIWNVVVPDSFSAGEPVFERWFIVPVAFIVLLLPPSGSQQLP